LHSSNYIYLKDGKEKNKRHQIQQSDKTAKIRLFEAVHHREAIHPRGTLLTTQAAFNAGIHYSTAKTILFFHKKQYKNYSTYIVEDPQANAPHNGLLMATWKDLPIDVDAELREPSKIEIVVNSKKRMLE